MKKLLTLSTICIITSLLFSSCRSNMSITKRHYTGGYYIAHNKGKQKVTPAKEEKTVQGKPNASVYSLQTPTEQNVQSGYSVQGPVAENNATVASNQKRQAKTTPLKNTDRLKRLIAINPIVQIKHIITPKKVVIDDERRGLSLFWVVILIILILWALGFLGGYIFGGLINLLLLIAAILIVLWLLRII